MKIFFKIFTIFTLSTLLVFISCQKEFSGTVQNSIIRKNTPLKFQMGEAESFFNDNYKLGELVGLVVQSDFFSPINQLQPSPIWNSALRGRVRDAEFYEVPLMSNLGRLGVKEKNANAPSKENLWNINRLVVLKKSDGVIEAKFMILIPEKKYLNHPDKQIDLQTMSFGRLPSDFSGDVQYYNLNGSFSDGWRYENGQIAGIIKMTDGRSSVVPRDQYWDCTTTTTDWYQISGGSVSYLGATTSTSCIPSGSPTVGSNTTMNIGSIWNNTNGTGGGTNTSDGSLAGETVDAAHQLCPNTFVFISRSAPGFPSADKIGGLSAVTLGFVDKNGIPVDTQFPYITINVGNNTTTNDVANVFNTALTNIQNSVNAARGLLDRFAGNQSQMQNCLRSAYTTEVNRLMKADPTHFSFSSTVDNNNFYTDFVPYQATKVFPNCN